MTFIRRIMNIMNIDDEEFEELPIEKEEKSDSFELEIYDKIHRANNLASTVENTNDSLEFYESIKELKDLLMELETHEHEFDFSPSPSSSLKELTLIEKKRISFFESCTLERKNEEEIHDMVVKDSPGDAEFSANEKNGCLELKQERNDIKPIKDIVEHKDESSIENEPYISNRFVIHGLNYHFIDAAREIVTENRILKIPLMREYDLSELQLKEIITELRIAGIVDAGNQVIIDRESLERLLDIYEPSLFECKNTVFDKEIFLCIGEIIYEDGIETTYDSLPADELMEYLDIMEKLNIIKYNCDKNDYDILMTKEQYEEVCKCIPSSFSSSEFDSNQNKYEGAEYDCMTGIEFERFCAYVLSKNGFENIRITPPSGDHGIDITAERKEISYAIQCKCYSENIGNSAIQQAHTGKSLYHKDIAVVMTNRHFTRQAIEEANALGVKLWDREKLEGMIGRG